MNSEKKSGLTFEFPELDPHRRLWELVLHIARVSQFDERFSKVKLVKIIYFADATSFLKSGKPISGSRYVKLPYGPCPDDFQSLLQEMEASGEIKITKEPYYNQQQIRIAALREPRLNDLFQAEDIALVDEIIRRFWDKNATELSHLSHETMAWQTTKDNEFIPYETTLLSNEDITENDIEHVQKLIEKYGIE